MKDFLKFVVSSLIIILVFFLLTRDEGIYYAEIPLENNCTSDFMGSCN